jgi:hypothetical protein
MPRPATGQQTHGTEGGYQMHMQFKTPPCFPCRHALNVARAEQRQRGRCAKGLGWPLEAPPLEVSRA